MRIGHKITVGFLLIAVIAAAVGFFSIAVSQRALEQTIGEDSILFAKEILDKIDRNIYHRLEQIRSYSDGLMPTRFVKESNEKFDGSENIEEYIKEQDKKWLSAAKDEITPFMQEIISNDLSEELRNVIEKKKFYMEQYDHRIFSEVFITNKYGANIAQTTKTTDYYQADEIWWEKAAAEGFYIGDLTYDKSANAYALDVAVRIDCPQDGGFGIIKAVLNIQEIIDIIKEHEQEEVISKKYGQKTSADAVQEFNSFRLLTKDKRVIYSTEGFETFEKISPALEQILVGEDIDMRIDNYWIITPQKSTESLKLYSYAYSRGYKDFKGFGWILVRIQDADEIFVPVARLRLILLFCIGMLVIIIVFVGVRTSRNISSEIDKLKKATVEIGKGKLDKKIEVETKDEVSELAESFNKMIDRLKISRVARQRSETALMESENRFRTLFESATEAIFIIKDGKFIDCNPAALELFGCSRYEIIGHSPAKFSPSKQPDGMDSVKKVIEKDQLAYSGKPQRFYWQHRRLDGTLLDAEISLNVLELSSGVYLQAIARDITAQKKAEEIIQRDKKALEKLVKKRTDELVETQRKVASLQRLSDIGALAATVAHELRNPLGVIKTAIFNVKKKRENENIDKHLDNIDKKILESERIVRNLLSYSMIKKPQLEKIKIIPSLEQIIEHLHEKYPKHKINIILKYNCQKEDMIIGDPLHLSELLSNILDNAYQAFPEKTGKINLKVDCDYKKGKINFSIKDNGIGIEKKDLKDIFKPFFTKKTKGIGLGLTVCKQIIDLHGGEINIESRQAKGTAVLVTLPWKKVRNS